MIILADLMYHSGGRERNGVGRSNWELENKMQRCFRLYSVTVFVDFEVKRWLAFILSLITSFLLVLLCFCLSHFTDMMNVAVALQRVQSHQRVSSGHVRGRINNTKASKYNPGKNIFWHRRYSDLSESSAIAIFPSSLLFKLMCF